ncbi:MAG: NAD-binding protein [Elusimicrobiota bacterium]
MFAEIKEKLLPVILILASVLLVGTVGYVVIEGWSVFDGLYMTIITVATVGYGETHPLSIAGRVFTIFLIFGGLGAVGYAFSTLTAFIIEGELRDVLRRRKMLSKIAALRKHYIICGGGNTGRIIMEELSKTERPFVVIEKDEERAKHLQDRGWLAICGDAMGDEELESAGVHRAHGVFCVLADDRDNVFAVISARGLNPMLRIVSELHDDSVRDKLQRSGADAVVSSGFIGGLRMASEMIRPAAVGFMDHMIRDKQRAIRFEEVPIPDDSPIVGKPLGELKGSQGGAALVLALREGETGRYEFNPSPERNLEAAQVLVVIGDPQQVKDLKTRVGA